MLTTCNGQLVAYVMMTVDEVMIFSILMQLKVNADTGQLSLY